ncbi:hypothetical protein MKW92_009170 [Papaver armeniacum]|nr:hypothetical protein MKW92_009170 [Papaver armeniacum]
MKTESKGKYNHFNDLGTHGTKVIIYNLWFTDDGEMDLNFESDVNDIQLAGALEMSKKSTLQALCQQHLANKLHYSLCVSLCFLLHHLMMHVKTYLTFFSFLLRHLRSTYPSHT